MATKRPEVLLLVGMSGAGRSASSNVFEDLGYYVIENLPAELVESVVQSNDVTETNKQLVLTIDAKDNSAQTQLKVSLDKLSQSGVLTRIIFLDANNETLIERYEENRRLRIKDLDIDNILKIKGVSKSSILDLIKNLKTLNRLSNASLNELEKIINENEAKKVYDYFNHSEL